MGGNKELIFSSEEEYLKWESKSGNTIYALQDMQGRYIGDIREKDLLPLWDANRVTSFDNPKNQEEAEFQDKYIHFGCDASWSITNDNDKEIWSLLVSIIINPS